MKKRILVTGGTGYIGSHTVVELQNSGYEVIIIDNLSNSSADVVDNIEKVSGIRPVFEELDCLDFAGLDALFTKYKGIEAIMSEPKQQIVECDAGQEEIDRKRKEAKRLLQEILDDYNTNYKHLNRNDKCTCGSNKKFKQCHLIHFRQYLNI